MPFTPFHFGPGAAVHAVAPRYFSFTVFCFAQIVTDVETAYYMLRGEYPLHRWFHTYLGATIIAVLCILVGRSICEVALHVWIRWEHAPFKRYFPATNHISFASAAVAAFVGTYSHVFLDSIMHADVAPFKPFSSLNPLYGLISWFTLHALCVVLGVFGMWRVGARSTKQT